MKPLLTLLLFAASASPVYAQLEKGNILAGGTGSFAANGRNGFSGGITLSPRAGLFLTDRLAVGANVGLGLTTYSLGAEGRVTSYGASLSPFARYYFSRKAGKEELTNKLVPFAEIGGGLGSAWIRGDAYYGNTSRIGVSGYGMLGLNYFLNKHVALEANVSYQRSSDLPSNLFFGQRGLTGGIGFQIFLDRKKQRVPVVPAQN
jgi:hypothetical protein